MLPSSIKGHYRVGSSFLVSTMIVVGLSVVAGGAIAYFGFIRG